MVNNKIGIKVINIYLKNLLIRAIQVEDLETLFCNSNDFNVPNINKDFPYGSPEENILFFKDVTPQEAQNVKIPCLID